MFPRITPVPIGIKSSGSWIYNLFKTPKMNKINYQSEKKKISDEKNKKIPIN